MKLMKKLQPEILLSLTAPRAFSFVLFPSCPVSLSAGGDRVRLFVTNRSRGRSNSLFAPACRPGMQSVEALIFRLVPIIEPKLNF